MMRRALCAAAAVLLTCVPTQAQTTELGVMAGFTPSVALEKHALEIDEAKIGDGLTFAFQVARFLSPHWGIEGLWSQQSSDFEVATSSGDADLFSMFAGSLHGNVVYQFGAADAVLQPFVIGGIGATFFRAKDMPSETKLSYGLGGGIKYMKWKPIGLRAQFRYKPTRLNDTTSGDFCDAFGFCQASLRQFDVLAGVILRF